MPKKPPKKTARKQKSAKSTRPKKKALGREPDPGLAEELQTLLEQEAELAQEVPLSEGSDLTYRDEANVIVHQVIRSGFLEDLHAGESTPILSDPKYSRITQDEMKRLMIETSAGLAHWLYTRDIDLMEDPRHYIEKLEMLHNIYTSDWERRARKSAVPARAGKPSAVCGSCKQAIHDTWRFCPMCGAESPTQR